MLSYISMNPHQWQEHSYVACCGTSPIPVMQMLKPDTQKEELVPCLSL